MTDDNRGEFARYLNDHPDEAAKLRASIGEMVAKYKLAENTFAGMQEQLGKLRQQTFEAIQTTYIPDDLFTRVRDSLAAVLPANWPNPMPDLERIHEVLETDGIPIVHIPRAEIVQAIVDSDDYDARVRIIEERADDIAEDCKLALSRDYDESLKKQVPLILRAVEAYRAGHYEAAQALAVAVCDTHLKRLFKSARYKDMAEKVAIDESTDASAIYAFNVHYALAPAVRFLDPWWPGDEGDPPAKLSRHLSTHNASTDYMTNLYAVIAIMRATSMSAAIDFAMTRINRNR